MQPPAPGFFPAILLDVPRPPSTSLTLRQMLRSGAFSGRFVEYRARSGAVLLTGVVTGDGRIRCSRGGGGAVSCSEFEELAGSKERRPGENIFLTGSRTNLKDLCSAVAEAAAGDDVAAAAASLLGAAGLPNPQSAKPRGTAPSRQAGRKGAAASLGVVPAAGPAATAAAGGPTCERERSANKQRLLFGSGLLKEGQRLSYRCGGQEALLTGTVQGHGILCSCCQGVLSCSQFEMHAGRGNRRAPYDNIVTDDGVSLRRIVQGAASVFHDGEEQQTEPLPPAAAGSCRTSARAAAAAAAAAASHRAGEAPFRRAASSRRREAEAARLRCGGTSAAADAAAAGDEQLFEHTCLTCGEPGLLLCCDACPAAYHTACAGLLAPPPPSDPWHCAACAASGATMPSEAATAAVGARARRLLAELETRAEGCVLCRCSDFTRDRFGPRTVLLCDMCEREYHVGCLRCVGRCDLSALPVGDWFCEPACARLHETLLARVVAGPQPLADLLPGALPGFTLQLLRGRRGGGEPAATRAGLAAALAILQDSFDPIADAGTGRDHLPLMVSARAAADEDQADYRGMHTAVLRLDGAAVSAATVRFFGVSLAEVPLVATAENARRRGHAQLLVAGLEALAHAGGAARLVLPAAEETLHMWTSSFDFMPLDDAALRQLRSDFPAVLVFPHSTMLYKPARPPADIAAALRLGAGVSMAAAADGALAVGDDGQQEAMIVNAEIGQSTN